MVLTPRIGHTVAYEFCHTQQYQVPQGTFCYWNKFKEIQLNFSLLFGLKPPIQSIPQLWNQPFLRREAAWVYFCLQRQGHHQNQSLTGPAHFFVYSACYCIGGGGYA
jgi:hypothetical protein